MRPADNSRRTHLLCGCDRTGGADSGASGHAVRHLFYERGCQETFFSLDWTEEVLVASSPWQGKAIELMRSCMAMLRAGTTLFDSRSDASIALARWPTMVLSETRGL